VLEAVRPFIWLSRKGDKMTANTNLGITPKELLAADAAGVMRLRNGPLRGADVQNNLHEATPIEILLVEDSAGDVRLTKEALRDAKVQNNLHVVLDGVEATAFVRREGKYANAPRPDLILLDLNLPKKSGRDVLEELKSDASLKTIPVVILTTSSAEEDILRSYELHANCYITKPVDLDQFLKVIRAIDNFWLAIVKLPRAVS
jgi:CheY-like chemotaxis protein